MTFCAHSASSPSLYGSGMLERLREAAPQGYTAMLDNVGGETIDAALALGIAPERINTIADQAAAGKHGLGTVGGGRKTSEELAELARLAADGELVLPIRASYPLTEVRAAYEELETGHGLGKVVLTFRNSLPGVGGELREDSAHRGPPHPSLRSSSPTTGVPEE